MSAITLQAMSHQAIGGLLREWRQRRHLSQMELALDAGVSARHLSFVETGRARPSADMVLHLAEQLDVPLRERNQLLLAAGYAPRFGRRSLDDPDMAQVRDALSRLLAAHEPFPAITVDRQWNLVASNAALGVLLDGVADELLQPPVNALRLALHPEGVAPRVLNLGQWRGHLMHRLEREIAMTGDSELAALRDELRGYPGEEEHPPPGPSDLMIELRIAGPDGEPLAFFSTITTFGTAVDVTVAELSVEAFFPADERTAEVLSSAAAAAA